MMAVIVLLNENIDSRHGSLELVKYVKLYANLGITGLQFSMKKAAESRLACNLAALEP